MALNAPSSRSRSRSAANTSVIQTSAPLFDAATQKVQRGCGASREPAEQTTIATSASEMRIAPPCSREPHAREG